MTIKLIQSPFSDKFVSDFIALTRRLFPEGTDDWIGGVEWRLKNMPDVTVFAAYSEDDLIAYKGGYATAHDRYYSWLGGVDEPHRKQGIATSLMKEQHQWLKTSRFKSLENHVAQNNANMVQLNQKYDFSITGLFLKNEKPYFIMSKVIEE